MRALPASLVFSLVLAVPVLRANASEIPIRVGLDTRATEWVVSLDGGGRICSRDGRVLMPLRPGERLRIWWDAQAQSRPAEEYRVQVGGPVSQTEAEALLLKLGAGAERLPIPDSESFRVVCGHFATATGAEPLLSHLRDQGFTELWISTERLPGQEVRGQALYAVTDRYERLPLPSDGIRMEPAGEWTQLAGKGRYRGRVEIFPNAQGRLTVVDTVELESYLRGVVPRELGPGIYPALEALKAQAVAARTYAWSNRGKRAKDGFDMTDTVADQVYGGMDAEQKLSDQAVDETRGLLATYGGRPIQALFMANSGGQTVDNTYVFGEGHPYLKGVSSYLDTPVTLRLEGAALPQGLPAELDSGLLRLAAWGLLPLGSLKADQLESPLESKGIQATVDALAQRLGLQLQTVPATGGRELLLWMARCLGFGQVVEGLERPQDADYFLGRIGLRAQDEPLAAFLVRRGLVPPALWTGRDLRLGEGLKVLGALWRELEAPAWHMGTLLRDGTVKPKGGDPEPLRMAPGCLLAEEAPGGSLRLVPSAEARAGDQLRWLSGPSGALLLVRRLDPEGASLDRYNATAHWRAELGQAELLDRLRAKAGIRGLKDLKLVHNEAGRVLEMTVLDGVGRSHRFTGMRIRGLLGLKDNAFRLLVLGSGVDRRWIFYGRGWGHGVGMDQSGAYGFALEGWDFERILKHYYDGIQLMRIGD
nr:SpoIID/LytB domain-containing protein [uncultured Holophaga sp.]